MTTPLQPDDPSVLAAKVAHELRAPLTGILGYAELLAADDVDDESRRNFAKTILGEAIRLRDMIGDLEAGTFRPRVDEAREAGDRMAASGAADVLTKPFSREGLLESVGVLLEGGPASILVVDDDPTIRRLVMTTLEREGVDFREASDGTEALARIAERRPDVILLDLEMPGLDGFGVLDSLRQDYETRSIPVIVLTARNVTPGERARLRDQTIALRQKSGYSADELRRLVGEALP